MFGVQQKFKTKPWSYKVPVYIKRWYGATIGNWLYRYWKKPKQSFKNLVAGFGFFPDEDGFSFHHNASRYAAKRLRYMRSFARNYPVYTSKSDLAHSIKPVVLKDEPAYIPQPGDLMWHDVLDKIIFFHEISWQDDYYFLNESGKRRYRTGKYFYFRYYESLWD